MNYRIFSLVFGFVVWLVATLIFRFYGADFFDPGNALVMAGLYIGTVPVLGGMMHWVFTKFALTKPEINTSTLLLTIPGMLADVLCLNFHQIVFPDLSIEQVIALGGWILWAYVWVLILGLLYKRA